MIATNRKCVLMLAAALLAMPALSWGSGFALFEVGGRAGAMAGAFDRYGVNETRQREIEDVLAACDTGRFAAGAVAGDRDRLVRRARQLRPDP